MQLGLKCALGPSAYMMRKADETIECSVQHRTCFFQ